MSDGDDGELLARLRAGDPGALDGFVRATHTDVWRLVAYLADPDTADDLTQQTYERALQALPGFRGEATLRTWLLAIARRVVADELRARGRHRRLAAAAAQHHRELTADVGEQVLLRQLVAGLEPARRESFVLTQLVGLSYAEAAEVAGVPVGTIRSRVARARADLSTALTDTDTDTDADFGTG